VTSPVVTEPDPLYLLFEPVYSSLTVTISSLHFITTCITAVIESLNCVSLGEHVRSATRNSTVLWLACNLWHTDTGTKYFSFVL